METKKVQVYDLMKPECIYGRKIISFETQTNIYNIGPDGSYGMRTVTYDHGDRPAMRINIK